MVVTVTLAYILFNLPFTLLMMSTFLILIQVSAAENLTVGLLLTEYFNLKNSWSWYVIAMVRVTVVGCNSLVNPLVYFCRMRLFRAHVVAVWSGRRVHPGEGSVREGSEKVQTCGCKSKTDSMAASMRRQPDTSHII